MEQAGRRVQDIIMVLAVLVSSLVSGCGKMSDIVRDQATGMNGGFEVAKSGLPVNWLVYTPETIPTGDYDLIIDTTEFRSGKQSLKFVVRDCSPDGGWHSPGIDQEYKATPGTTYTVGFWIKNSGARFSAEVGGVSAFDGQMETIVKSTETLSRWTHFEYEYTMPTKFNRLRFQFNVLQPGTLWIDDVTIDGISDVGTTHDGDEVEALDQSASPITTG